MGLPPFNQLSFPELYEQALVRPLFQPWAGPLLDDVALVAGDRLLDVACGTGIVARVAAERLGGTGTVVGVDLNPAMLAVARRQGPEGEWREGSAEALPLFENERFDVVVCQQGLQFFPDRPAAVREMRRALVPGGRLGLSTWCPDEEFPVLRELRRVAESHLGPIADRRHCFGAAGPVEALLADAGFSSVRSKQVTRTIRFADGTTFVRLNAMALVGMSAQAKTMTGQEREELTARITRESEDLVRAHTDTAGFAYDIGTTVVTARA
jgi:ubiquinone/menaquinone biosynthesis C-methylase UbiE